jgi:hypothetical protein
MDDSKTDKSINNIKLGHYFDYIEIESDYLITCYIRLLRKLLIQVSARISIRTNY